MLSFSGICRCGWINFLLTRPCYRFTKKKKNNRNKFKNNTMLFELPVLLLVIMFAKWQLCLFFFLPECWCKAKTKWLGQRKRSKWILYALHLQPGPDRKIALKVHLILWYLGSHIQTHRSDFLCFVFMNYEWFEKIRVKCMSLNILTNLSFQYTR